MQALVILAGMPVVPGFGNQVAPLSILPQKGGTLKTRDKKRREYTRTISHA
jgi:hypothetical protein